MVGAPKVIETGVDKLMELVRAKKRISIQDAAKILSVPQVVVGEWATFLEEEGIIGLEYKFATQFMVERAISPAEMEKKSKEFLSKKEGFVRKIESTLALLENEMNGFKRMRGEFEQLSREAEAEIQKISRELQILERFEKMKAEADEKLLAHETTFRKRIAEINKDIMEKKELYGTIMKSVEQEKAKLDSEKGHAELMIRQEEELEHQLDKLKNWIQIIRSKTGEEETKVKDSRGKIEDVKNLFTSIEEEVKNKEQELRRLTDETKAKERKIMQFQEEIIRKIVQEKKRVTRDTTAVVQIQRRFRATFEKKAELNKLINLINFDMGKLKEEFEIIVKKAKIVGITGKKGGMDQHIGELEQKYMEVEKRRKKFQEEVSRLGSALRRR